MLAAKSGDPKVAIVSPCLRDRYSTQQNKRDATIEQVTIPEHHEELIGAETIYGLNTILQYYDLEPLTDQYVEKLFESQQTT